MKTIKHIVFCFFIILGISSCVINSDPISRMEELVSELENNSANYTIEDWKIVEEEYNQIMIDADNYQLNESELNYLAKLKGKYYAYYVKSSSKLLKEELDRQSQLWDNALEGFLEGL